MFHVVRQKEGQTDGLEDNNIQFSQLLQMRLKSVWNIVWAMRIALYLRALVKRDVTDIQLVRRKFDRKF